MTTTPLPPAHRVGAVIVAAGASTRMQGADKTLADLGGEPLIAHAVDAFEQCAAVGAIALVAAERNLDAIAALRIAKGWRKTMPPLPGGARRQDSVRIGLHALPPECEWALVHDGARPFVTSLMIEDGLRAAADTGAAIAVVPAFDTVKRVAADGRVIETLDRSELAMTQTPQVFRRDILERAHTEITVDVTDDAAMVERMGDRGADVRWGAVEYQGDEPGGHDGGGGVARAAGRARGMTTRSGTDCDAQAPARPARAGRSHSGSARGAVTPRSVR